MTDSNNNNSNGKIYLGGLWDNQSKAGNAYISGGIGVGGKVMIYPNQYKEKASDPDYKMYLVEKAKKDDKPKQDLF